MEFDSVISKRKSVRSFKSKKVSWKNAMDAIEVAVKVPFADNRCNLKFIIIEDEKKINKLAELSNQLWINEAGIVIMVCSDDTNLENVHGERGRMYSRQQAGAAIENLLLKITDLGLSACWIGSFTDEIIKQSINIPTHIQIEAIIPIGYESGKSEKKPNPSLDSVIYWEEWEQSKRPALFRESTNDLS